MTTLLLLLLASGQFKNGKFTDPFWAVSFSLPKLAETVQREKDAIFAGHTPNGLRVEVAVRESENVLPAAKWRETILAEWTKRKPENVDAERDRLLFTVKHLGVFDQHHGFALHARGHQCFIVHAWFGDRTDKSGKLITAALGALKLAPDPGSGVRVRRVALQRGKDELDPAVLLEAGELYMKHTPIPALAARVLARARKLGKYEGMDKFRLNLVGGRALTAIGRYAEALAWLQRAEQVKLDDKTLNREAAYELACACSVANKLDEGFAALHRAFRDGLVVGKGVLSQEKTLGNLRKDPRWEKFWKECVAGR